MLTYDEINRLVERIVARIQPEKVIVFGSYAKGIATINSDLDVLVVKDTHLPMQLRSDALLPIISNFLIRVDVHVYTPEEVEEYGREQFSFLNSVFTSGKVVYERTILESSGETFDTVSQRRKEENAGINLSSERKIDANQIVGRSDAVRKRGARLRPSNQLKTLGPIGLY